MLKSLGLIARAFAFASCAAACGVGIVVVQAQSPRAVAKTFRGALGPSGKTTIQMRVSREGGRLSGSYFYEGGAGGDLSLRGTIDAAGDFTLQEFDAAGAQTGLFKGRWAAPECGDCSETLKGRWTRPDGTRPLEFVLAEYMVFFEGGARLVPQTVKESRRRGKWGGYEISAEYPQLRGGGANAAGFNEAVRAYVTKDVAGFRKQFSEDPSQGGELDLGYYVSYADDSLVSVDFSDYFYYFGAGSRSAASTTFNYDLSRGRALALADLFKPSSGYLKVITDVCNRELRRQFEGESFPDAERIAGSVEGVAGDDKKWLVSREGLVVVFDSTEFGPSGSGEHTVVVPYAALRSFVRADGPLARFVK